MSFIRQPTRDWECVRHSGIKYVFFKNGRDKSSIYHPYKLHISIDKKVNLDPEIEKKLLALLDEVLQHKIIACYKYWPLEIRQQKKSRNAHLPYVIYLRDKPSEKNLDCVAELCRRIERLFKDVTPAPAGTLAKSDLVVSEHITFRLSARVGTIEYISARDEAFAEILREQGSKSKYYQHLCKEMAPFAESKKEATEKIAASSNASLLLKVGGAVTDHAVVCNQPPLKQAYPTVTATITKIVAPSPAMKPARPC